jgi:hypothetical protein
VAPQLSPEELEQKRILELEKHYHRRRCIAQEIIQTERTYVGHLSDIVEVPSAVFLRLFYPSRYTPLVERSIRRDWPMRLDP